MATDIEKGNMELMQTLDDAWNAQEAIGCTLERRADHGGESHVRSRDIPQADRA